ncbi:MAG: type IV pilus twitching motility protein PilT [Candidatus Poribacteria bacterium]|nr:type IV pilus twitching motility protein PilT [Candidatus Poribacteria bacterium]
MPNIEELLKQTVEHRASDLLIVADAFPTVRVDGELHPLLHEKLKAAEVRCLVYRLLSAEQIKRFEEDYELDFSYFHPSLGRFRINVHFQKGSVAAAIRHFSTHIPRFDELGLPDSVSDFAAKRNGLVLVTGPAGSGKSTTLAALIHLINTQRACHIITIEDPVEYMHTSDKSVVEQREIFTDTHSYAHALKHVLRQSPDVILIGEMRDLETIAIALTAAETGHLVLATLHTIDACQTIYRIIDSFPADQQNQIRAQLSMSLQGVISQVLLPRADDTGQVVAVEVMKMTSAISASIRNNKPSQIYSSIQTGKSYGMQTRDQALKALVQLGTVEYEAALPYVKDLTYFRG